MRKILIFILLAFLYFILPTKVSAQEEFFVDAYVKYDVQDNGETKTTFEISLINAGDDLYSTSYTLNLKSIKPKNFLAKYKNREIPLKVDRLNNDYSLELSFDDIVVGLGEKRNFLITFEEESFATKTGEVWEISIPRLTDDNSFRKFDVELTVPSSFGNEAFVSPEPQEVNKTELQSKYLFTKKDIAESGITTSFGQFQVFTFSLNYHLENPLNKDAPVEIALPPDTSFQRLYYQKIEPAPENIRVDNDGNWLATYFLKPRERININAFGSVQIFASPIKLPTPLSSTLASNKKPSEYWQVDDPEIIKLAESLKTPRNIYNYVSSNLSYDYGRVKPNVKRLGAKEALNNKDSAICMEYADLFIALARASGIAAREVNGFAYTENPEIQPLSLVADVLHAWPEYWDEERKAWIPIDPTWGSTTGGVDYFTKLDLRHFTFVIHGENATLPYAPGSYKLGPNPQKDVFVAFGQLPLKRQQNLEIVSVRKRLLPFMTTKILVNIENTSPSAFYEVRPKVLFDGQVAQETYIETLPPFGKYEMQVFVPFSLFGTKIPNEIKIVANNTEVIIPTSKNQIVILNLITIVFLLITITLVVVNKTGRISLTFNKKQAKKVLRKIKDYVRKIKKPEKTEL